MINKDIKAILIIDFALTISGATACAFMNLWCSLVCVVLGVLLAGVFIYYTKQRYNKLNELNNYLTMVCSGNYDLDIEDNAEGELSILKNNLYKVIILLRSQNELLKKDKLYLSDSLADISHQLKTPMTSMMVMTDLLRDEKNPDKKEAFISIIENQLDKMKWLVLNLLKLSKLDAGTAEFKIEQTPLREIIEESIKPFLVILELKDIKIINNVDNFEIKADKNWSVEAFENIIKNCIEHTQKGGEIVISSDSTNIYKSVTIRDNGCGIEEEDLPHIFERFYHGKNSSSDSVGIGLALSKMIFEKEKGTVSALSTVGQGTTFEIRFYNSII